MSFLKCLKSAWAHLFSILSGTIFGTLLGATSISFFLVKSPFSTFDIVLTCLWVNSSQRGNCFLKKETFPPEKSAKGCVYMSLYVFQCCHNEYTILEINKLTFFKSLPSVHPYWMSVSANPCIDAHHFFVTSSKESGNYPIWLWIRIMLVG